MHLHELSRDNFWDSEWRSKTGCDCRSVTYHVFFKGFGLQFGIHARWLRSVPMITRKDPDAGKFPFWNKLPGWWFTMHTELNHRNGNSVRQAAGENGNFSRFKCDIRMLIYFVYLSLWNYGCIRTAGKKLKSYQSYKVVYALHHFVHMIL